MMQLEADRTQTSLPHGRAAALVHAPGVDAK